ncbi:MAG: PorT family protein [Bacteroidia bacterium]|nr:PorT family protein [Bacteroidia bacterium]
MKFLIPIFFLALVIFMPGFLFSQPLIRANLGINGARIADGDFESDERLIPGLQAALGLEIPQNENWYLVPSLSIAQGGWVERYRGVRYGDRNIYAQLGIAGGYVLPIDVPGKITAELGPHLNFWTRTVGFTNENGLMERFKGNLGIRNSTNRFFGSLSAEVDYHFDWNDINLSAGIRFETGFTPIESYSSFSGMKFRSYTNSLSLVAGASYPLKDFFSLKDEFSDMFEVELNPEDLVLKTPFEEAYDSYKKARDLVNDAYFDDEKEASGPELALDALEELERTKRLLGAGIKAWEKGDDEGIGPEARKVLERFIKELEERAYIMKDSVFEEEVVIDDGDDPTDTPPPTIYGEEISPPWITVKGAMAPSQGVWQDDDYFEDKPTKQLTKESETSYHAELDMVANRYTAVFGLKGSRSAIYMSGKSTYTQTIPVRFRLKLIQGGSEKIIWTEPTSSASVPLAGGEGPEVSWSVSIARTDESPIPKNFKMVPGPYTLELELIDSYGKSTGLKISTHGKVVETQMPKVHIVPVLLSDDWTVTEGMELTSNAKRLKQECDKDFYDYFPVPVDGVDVRAEALQFLGSQELGTVDYLISLLPLTNTEEEVREERAVAHLTQRFSTTAQLGGAGRVIVLLNDKDFSKVYRNDEGIGGFAPHPKVQFMRFKYSSSTIAHELIHSFPYVFSAEEMAALCGFSYHNSDDNDYGNGVSIFSAGVYFHRGWDAIMGPVSVAAFITQCSFWHLIQQFQKPNDPELFLVRGYLAQANGQYAGVFSPTYEFEGDEGLQQGAITTDGWGIVLKDKNGNVLATYPFEVIWQYPDESKKRELVAFNHRIDRLPGTASIELIGPGGKKAEQLLSASKPSVEINYPKEGELIKNGKRGIGVKWEGNDPDGDNLSYRLQASFDDGENWFPLGDEIQKENFKLRPFERARKVKLRVYATDGVRSDMKEVGFWVVP